MRKQRIISLCLALALALSLAACNSQTDEQNSTQPTPSVQPTVAPTPAPTPPPIPYNDVSEDDPYFDAVVWAYKNGIASDGETFGPADTCTRGQVMTFLWRANGSPEPQTAESPFSDVSFADWFYQSALSAYENNIASGTAFNPGNPCTNAEALTFLWRAEGKPAASVYDSAVALTASGQYYARPAAWAEVNGLFDEADFDPAAPCSRADLMMYLHWVTEEWTFAEEDKAVQAEYEQIINDAQLYEVYRSGLCFADYVDVEGDGKVELLTVGFGEDITEANVTVYANIDGHAGKFCEGTFENYFWKENEFSFCKADGKLFLHTHGKTYLQTWGGNDEGAEEQRFFKIEKENFALEDGFSIGINGAADEVFDYVAQEAITTNESTAILQKYADEKGAFARCSINPNQLTVLNRGLLPDPSAVMQEIYAAVKNGDFSAFAGTYKNRFGDSLMLDNQGILTGGGARYATNQKPISIEVTKNGIICCEIIPVGYVEQKGPILAGGDGVYVGDSYYIYPVGIEMGEYIYAYDEYGYEVTSYIGPDSGSDKVRIAYLHWGGSAGLSISASDLYD